MEIKILPKDTIIYRSYNDDAGKIGYWYSMNAEDVYGYGSQTGVFKTKKDLKLINICHENFYTILKNEIKNQVSVQPNIKDIMHEILFPLGFDDITFYRDLAKTYGIDNSVYTLNPKVHTESLLFFNNRSRLSIKEIDSTMMKFLNRVFGAYVDGIISDKHFPDIIRNGLQFPELSVFDKSNIEYQYDYARPLTGGSLMDNNMLMPVTKEELTPYAWERIKIANQILDNMNKVELVPGEFKSYNISPIIVNSENNTNLVTYKGFETTGILPPIKSDMLTPFFKERIKIANQILENIRPSPPTKTDIAEVIQLTKKNTTRKMRKNRRPN